MRNKKIELTEEIGGYFGLSLPDHGDSFSGMYKFQSARAALNAVLEFTGIKRVILPAYICGSVPRSLMDFGVTVEEYYLDDSFYPQNIPEVIPDGCVFLYVNYFGLCRNNIERLLKVVPANKLIVDNSQALFSPPTAALATIYSVRKFLGVPDGGLLATSGLDIRLPANEDIESLARMKHLLLRTAYSAREGYADYLESEKTLNNATPLRMSRLTRRLLASIEIEPVKKQRRENFLALAENLDNYNNYDWALDTDSVPFCYPLILDRDVDLLKSKLATKDIFIPTYWPDVKVATAKRSIEYRLKHRCLAVPCDQRYSRETMVQLAGMLISIIENTE